MFPPGPDHILPQRHTGASDLPSRILLATFLNHPHIFDRVEEDLCHMPMSSPRLDALKHAALAALADDPTLDREGLRTHLTEDGFADEMAALLTVDLYLHAGFARPDALPEQILAGWQEIVRRQTQPQHSEDQQRARQILSGDFSTENWLRLLELAEKPV